MSANYPKLSITEYVKKYGSANEIMNKSYHNKPHLGSLPHDRRTNDLDKLQERIDAIDERVQNNNEKIKESEDKLLRANTKLDIANQHLEKEEKSLNSLDNFIKMEENNIKKNEERAKRQEIEGVDTWNRYMQGLNEGWEDFTGPISRPWSSEKVERVRERAKELDKKVQKFKDKKKYSELSEKELEEMAQTNSEVKRFIKDLYDHQTNGMEMVWFEYGDPFTRELDIYYGIRDSKRLIEKYSEEKAVQEAKVEAIRKEMNGLEQDKKSIENDLGKLQRENTDYSDERGRTEDKMKRIRGD